MNNIKKLLQLLWPPAVKRPGPLNGYNDVFLGHHLLAGRLLKASVVLVIVVFVPAWGLGSWWVYRQMTHVAYQTLGVTLPGLPDVDIEAKTQDKADQSVTAGGGAPAPSGTVPQTTPGNATPAPATAPTSIVGSVTPPTAPSNGVVIDIYPNGSDSGVLQRALSTAAAGVTIRLNGTFPQQTVKNINNKVTVTSAPAAVLTRMTLTNVKQVTFRGIRVAGYSSWGGIEVHENSAHLQFDKVTIDATTPPVVCGINANKARGFQVGSASPGDRATWPNDIWLTNSDIYGAPVDLITVYTGGSNLHFIGNELHDFRPGTCDVNDEHNDGIQIILADTVEIRGNEIYSPPGRRSGPDQGIIIGANKAGQSVSNVTIADNVIRDWPGTGIVIAGEYVSNVTVTNNTVKCAWGGILVGSPMGPNIIVGQNTQNLTSCP